MTHPRHRLVSWLSSLWPDYLKRAEQQENAPVVSFWLQPPRPKPGTEEEWQAQLRECRERGKAANDSKETKMAVLPLNESSPAASLPFWPEPQRVAPNAILRSALFGVVKRGKRRFVEGKTPLLVSAWSGSSIKYFGQQLDQYDLDVWLQALHLARQQDLSDAKGIRFTARSFLTSIGRRYSGDAARVLFGSLRRMVACAVTIKVGSTRYTGSLIQDFVEDEPTEGYLLRLNPRLRALFDTGSTKLDWATRLTLPTDLSRWMHGYVLSHRATKSAPHRIGISALRDLSGSVSATLRTFRQPLRRAMNLLAEARVVTTWRVTKGDALEFVRPDTSGRDHPDALPG